MRFEPLGQKMFTRRNWLLRCSILINIAVILYICSHVMIGNRYTLTSGSQFVIQEQPTPVQQQPQMQQQQQQPEQGMVREPLAKVELVEEKQEPAKPLSGDSGGGPITGVGGAGGGSGVGSNDLQQPSVKDADTPEMDPNLGDPANIIGNTGSATNNFVNNTNADANYLVTGDEKDLDERLRSLLKCYDKPFEAETLQRGDFWVLKNYVRAEHGELKCHESITYTTHADYTFLDNLIPLLERWNAPVSIAMHAPGTDFQPTLDSIKYLRDCLPGSNLVRAYATFHIYFSTKHIPKTIPKYSDALKKGYNCTLPPPYVNVTSGHLYKTQKKLLYPVNVGRNIARDAAITHFILASDIELYPNPGLVKKFLEMIARNEPYLNRKSPRVFPLSIFEVDDSSPVPHDKSELQEFLRSGKAIPFHKRVCASCHGVPKSKEWMAANETDELSVFHIGKRTGYFVHWEPIYIGTNAEPHYDERLSWEGKSDKMTQGYALCVLDYEFHILDNAFLVHKPGIKVLKKDTRRAMLAGKTNQLIRKIIYPELKIMYGTRNGCAV
ncbi:beta-1,4-glucuronyltransferase 1 [Stomoxys calcitrans]|uniref:Beta-1,4-glucuronyltransferase 1 n=1 Tax=Stomoxys calcitrans TaxID=35570 RepID=A0A1I8PSV4_STOCA|nr:beta-1,4-glucuronyltransferase 1 [Stomoxys calcitrans]